MDSKGASRVGVIISPNQKLYKSTQPWGFQIRSSTHPDPRGSSPGENPNKGSKDRECGESRPPELLEKAGYPERHAQGKSVVSIRQGTLTSRTSFNPSWFMRMRSHQAGHLWGETEKDVSWYSADLVMCDVMILFVHSITKHLTNQTAVFSTQTGNENIEVNAVQWWFQYAKVPDLYPPPMKPQR